MKEKAYHGQYDEKTIYEIVITQIIPNDNQARFYFDQKKLEDLSSSIKEFGVLEPIIVCENKKGSVQLIAGERRFKAAKMAGLKTIPAIFHKENKKFEISLIENLLRENLNPVEKAQAMAKLKEKYGYTQEEIGELLGLVQSAVAEYLTLMKLPEEIREECIITTKYSKRKLLKIAKNKTSRQKRKEFYHYKKEVEKKEFDDNKNVARTQKSKICIIVRDIENLKVRLDKIEKDWDIEDPQEKDNLLEELESLKGIINQKSEKLSANTDTKINEKPV